MRRETLTANIMRTYESTDCVFAARDKQKERRIAMKRKRLRQKKMEKVQWERK